MSARITERYCADPEALSAMKHDGLGWGHDLECGCFHDKARPKEPNGLVRLLTVLKRRN